jgi:uncharacterized protein (TIRG00374 family)
MIPSLALIYISAAERWSAIMESLEYHISFFTSLKIISISYGLNKILPLNFGDLSRSKISEIYIEVEDHGEVLGGVAFERVSDVVTVSAVIGLSSLFLVSNYLKQVYFLVVGSAILIGVALFLFYKPNLIQKRFLDHFRPYLPEKLSEFSDSFIHSYSDFSHKELAKIYFLSSLRWLGGIAVLYIAGLSLGIYVDFWIVAFVNSVMVLVATLPISPGGIGPVETVGTGLLALSGLMYSDALAVIVVSRSIGFFAMAIIGYLVYLSEEYRISEI